MSRIEEARRKLQWCLEEEKVKFTAMIDEEDFDKDAYKVSFHYKGKVYGVKIPYAWLDDCIPEENIITGQMRGLRVCYS
jgi:hypothetical protein